MNNLPIPDRKKIRTTNTTMHKGDWSKPKDCRLSNVDNRERHLFNADGSPADHSKPSIANRRYVEIDGDHVLVRACKQCPLRHNPGRICMHPKSGSEIIESRFEPNPDFPKSCPLEEY